MKIVSFEEENAFVDADFFSVDSGCKFIVSMV